MKSLIFAMTLVSAVFTQAALLSFEPGTLQIENINLNKTATINKADGTPSTIKMDLLGAGLRSKTVLFVAAKVYVLQIFADNKNFDRNDNAVTSISTNSTSVVLKISMLRTVSAASLATSFREALEANSFEIDTELTALLGIIESSAAGTQGKTISMLMNKADGKTNVYYEDTTGQLKSFVGSASVMPKILSIWLGTPVDSGLATMKNQLLKSVY
ncbi:MAG: chalcone isomerase family protein [Pseudobdellovibrio sp.]